jgi:UDP-N-acetylmuramate: L-alanyl-gamma-D-glutamyl-meso-diaminopimelate ligase
MKHIHFIGICGVGMGSLAVMFKKMGWKVTGSDKGFFPPISDHLRQAKINFYPGWHPEKIGKPDLIVMGNFVSLRNPEYLYAQNKKITIKSFPELVQKYIIKKNSIVVAGTYAKTTITSFLAHLLKEAGQDPSWFVGGIALNLANGAHCGKGKWSVVEGDEYSTARWDSRSKFFWYQPTHLIITSVIWDHLDVFPKKENYLEAFQKLTKSLPSEGQILANSKTNSDNSIEKIIKVALCPVRRYGKLNSENQNDYAYQINSLSPQKTLFTVYKKNQPWGHFSTCLFGEHMIENLTAGIALGDLIGTDKKKIQKAVSSFQGVKRRLELRAKKNNILIFDDLAHSPSKTQGSLKALRLYFPRARIFAIYEPNVGNRTLSSEKFYQNSFNQADWVLIPRLSKTKTNAQQEKRFHGKELAQVIKEKNKKTLSVSYFEKDDQLIEFIKQKTKPQDIIIFLGSHSFRGMIEQLISEI